jgi:hypothetical protein
MLVKVKKTIEYQTIFNKMVFNKTNYPDLKIEKFTDKELDINVINI